MYFYFQKFWIKSKNFLLNKILAGKNLARKMVDFHAIFYYIQNVGVYYLSSVIASVEVVERFEGCLSVSHFFHKISLLNLSTLILIIPANIAKIYKCAKLFAISGHFVLKIDILCARGIRKRTTPLAIKIVIVLLCVQYEHKWPPLQYNK